MNGHLLDLAVMMHADHDRVAREHMARLEIGRAHV